MEGILAQFRTCQPPSPTVACGWKAHGTANGTGIPALVAEPVVLPASTVSMRARSSSPGLIKVTVSSPGVSSPGHSVNQRPPSSEKIPQPIPSKKTPVMRIAVPVESISHTTGMPIQNMLPTCQNVQLLPPKQSLPTPAISHNLLSNIDGVAVENESTILWIDRKMSAIEHRLEGCELQQAHVADLHRKVTEGPSWEFPRNDGVIESSDIGGSKTIFGSDDEFSKRMQDTSMRLSCLGAEHKVLKQEVEMERSELLHVRATLEEECVSRLAEVRSLGKHCASVAEHAIEAMNEVRTLQEQLRNAEVTNLRQHERIVEATEMQVAQDEDYRLLEEHSHTVLHDCRVLHTKVHELEIERAESANVHTNAEQQHEHQLLILESEQQQHAAAAETEKLHLHLKGLQDAMVREQHAHDESELKHTKVMEVVDQLRSNHETLREEIESEQTACLEARMQNQVVEAKVEKLYIDQQKLLADQETEQQALDLAEWKHLEVEKEVMKILAHADEMKATRDAEREAREVLEQKYNALTEELHEFCAHQQQLELDQHSHVDQQNLQALELQEAEQKHCEIEQIVEQMHADKHKLHSDGLTQQQLYEDATHKIKELEETVKDNEKSKCEQQNLQRDMVAEQRNAQLRHSEIEQVVEQLCDEKQKLELDELAQQQFCEDATCKLKEFEETVKDKEQLKFEHQHLHEAMVAEQHDVEQRHLESEKVVDQLRADKQKLQLAEVTQQQLFADATRKIQELEAARDAEQDARREAERKHMDVEKDSQQLCLHLKELQEGQMKQEHACIEEIEMQREICDAEIKSVRADMQKLQIDRDNQQQVCEHAENNHQALHVEKQILHDNQLKLQSLLEAEQRARKEVEQKHKDMEDAMQNSDEAKKGLEITWREKLEQAEKEIEALKKSEAGSQLSNAVPCEPSEMRPNINDIPPRYLQVLQQIENQGWHSVQWKGGYTMLHWAAEKSHADLCGYLIRLNADPKAQDRRERTPLDCATTSDVRSVIQEFVDKPQQLVTMCAASETSSSVG